MNTHLATKIQKEIGEFDVFVLMQKHFLYVLRYAIVGGRSQVTQLVNIIFLGKFGK